MKIAIAYTAPDLSRPDSKDVLDEVRVLDDALGRLQYECKTFAIGHEPTAGRRWLQGLAAYEPDAVWNLVEDWGPDPRRQALAAALLDAAGWAYTGSSFQAILTATDKALAKSLLTAHGLPTPAWQLYQGRPQPITAPAPWIIKPAWEDASVGIDDRSVVRDLRLLPAYLDEQYRRHRGQPLLIETFLEGREFSLSVLEHPEGRVEVLPPAEIVFTEWPADKPRIVGYRAKWEPDTFEYQHTLRRFEVDPRLAGELKRIAFDCWQAFGLAGYARVDLRCSLTHEPFVMEINPNPCIAPDAGFMEAAQQAGYAPEEVCRLVLEVACGKGRKAGRP
jgi:D-alanine-D-alanine ligase